MSLYRNPVVSVVMAIHKAERKMLENVMECVLNQTFEDFEFLIVDDGNDAGILEIIKEYGRVDPRVRLIGNTGNIGLTRSLIRGVRFARGRYIARQDVDDLSRPERLELQVNMMESNSDLVLLGSWFVLTANKEDKAEVRNPDHDQVLRKKMRITNPFCHSSVLFRKEVYEQVGGYDKNYTTTQDLDLWYRMAEKGTLGVVEKVLVQYGINEGSISRSSKAWVQVWNSIKIRMKYILKAGDLSGGLMVMAGAGWHIANTLLRHHRLSGNFVRIKGLTSVEAGD